MNQRGRVGARVGIGLLVVLGVGCDINPPAEISGADGTLDADDPYCFIYPEGGYASVYLDDVGFMAVDLPATAGVWGHTAASYAGHDPDTFCDFASATSAARVQYGAELVGDPDCDGCSTRYRALYVEGVNFPTAMGCAFGFGCDPTDCRTVEGTHADSLAMWCDSPDEFAL